MAALGRAAFSQVSVGAALRRLRCSGGRRALCWLGAAPVLVKAQDGSNGARHLLRKANSCLWRLSLEQTSAHGVESPRQQKKSHSTLQFWICRQIPSAFWRIPSTSSFIDSSLMCCSRNSGIRGDGGNWITAGSRLTETETHLQDLVEAIVLLHDLLLL